MTNSFKLEKPYIIKKIEPSAFKTALGSTYQTAYRLYLITNGIKEVQTFLESSNEDYFVTALIKTEAAVAGEAKRQVWAVKHLQPLLYKKPRYTVRCSVTDKKTNKTIYKCELTSSNQDVIYAQVQQCIEDLNEIL
mgnify:FL=1